MKSKVLLIILTVGGAVALHADPIAEIRGLYAEDNAAPLQIERFDFEEPVEVEEGEVKLHRDPKADGAVRKVVTKHIINDARDRSAEVYFDSENKARFVFFRQAAWALVTESVPPNNHVIELRFYFDPVGQLVSALRKEYEPSAPYDPKIMRAAADAAKNEPLKIDAAAAEKIKLAATGTSKADSPASARSVEEQLAASITPFLHN